MLEVFSPERSERISPFRGIRYNQEIVRDLAKVICPPYDIITPEQQKLYYEKSGYNAIRLEYPAESRQLTADSYQRAARTLQQWLKQGVLQADRVPSFYLHDHYFTYLGEKRRRRGLIARCKLEPWGSTVYPHEETFPKAKDDRLKLLRACRANFSSLLSLYHDSEQKIAPILSEASQSKPIIELTNTDESHIVWAITDPEVEQLISQFLSAQPLYIADGHHRYETALTYQQERHSYHPERCEESQKEAFNYIMMELVEFSDPGLVILPIHRLVRGIASSTLAGLKKQLENFFALEFIPLTEALSCHSEGSEESQPFASAQSMVLGILGLEPRSLVVLKQRQGTLIEAMMPGNRSQIYKRFSISILNHVILKRILGLKCHYSSGALARSSEALASEEESIAYTADLDEACQQIKEGKYQLAFLLSPPQPEVIKAIADAKDRMPRKSTYFYPKLPAGLIINSLV
jgi:uncharacterized protein (DUF1015 family)